MKYMSSVTYWVTRTQARTAIAIQVPITILIDLDDDQTTALSCYVDDEGMDGDIIHDVLTLSWK